LPPAILTPNPLGSGIKVTLYQNKNSPVGTGFILVQGEGFEPPNPKGADLQSAVFDRFTNPARPSLRSYLVLAYGQKLLTATRAIYCYASPLKIANSRYAPWFAILGNTFGADGGSRTHDPLFTKQPLWPLSYIGRYLNRFSTKRSDASVPKQR
jgi:hypothetical protein